MSLTHYHESTPHVPKGMTGTLVNARPRGPLHSLGMLFDTKAHRFARALPKDDATKSMASFGFNHGSKPYTQRCINPPASHNQALQFS